MLDLLKLEPVFNALGWAVLHSLWQGALIALIVAGVRSLISERHADTRYIIGITSLTAMLAAFIGTFLYYASSSAALSTAAAGEAGKQIITLSNTPTPGTALSLLTANTFLIGMVWTLCFLVIAVRYIGAWRQTQKLRTQGLSALPAAWRSRFARLARKTGVNARTRAYISEHVASPITFGFFKPIVLVPTWFFTGLSSEQCEMILLHELAHIRRHDYLTNILQIIAKTVFFYHPAVTYICKVTDAEREHACDDFATHTNGHAEDLALALGTIRLKSAKHAQAFALTADKPDAPLMYRLKRLVGTKSKRVGIHQNRAAAAMLVISFALAASLNFSQTQAHPHDEPKAEWENELAGKAKQEAHKSQTYNYGTFSKDGRTYKIKRGSDGKSWMKVDGNWYLTSELKERGHPVPPHSLTVPEAPAAPSTKYTYGSQRIDGKKYKTKHNIKTNTTYIKVDGHWYDIDETDLDNLISDRAELTQELAKEMAELAQELAEDRAEFEQEMAEEMTELAEELAEEERELEAEIRDEQNPRMRKQMERQREQLVRNYEQEVRNLEQQRRHHEQKMRTLEHKNREMERAMAQAERQQEQTIRIAERNRERSMEMAERQREKADKQRYKYEAMRDKLLPTLKADGYIKSRQSKVKMKLTKNDIFINGKKLDEKMEDKYCKIVSNYMDRKGDVKTIVIKPDYLHIEQKSDTGSHTYTYNK